MNKKYYEILEILENATPAEIKKAYRKLATKWHPDKFATKSLAERQKATEKMQELNEAYGVLGNEENRRRYDSGVSENQFNDGSDFATNSGYEEEFLRMQNLYETEIKEKVKKEEYLTRKIIIGEIKAEIFEDFEVFPHRDLDAGLWVPYDNWQEKVWKIKINELENFKKRMITAIKNKRISKKEQKRNSRNRINTNSPTFPKNERVQNSQGNFTSHVEIPSKSWWRKR